MKKEASLTPNEANLRSFICFWPWTRKELKNGLVGLPETNDAWVVSCIITAFDVNGAIHQCHWHSSDLLHCCQSCTRGLKPTQVPGGRQTPSTWGHSLQRGFQWGLEEAGRQGSGRGLAEHIIRGFEVLAIVGPLHDPTNKKLNIELPHEPAIPLLHIYLEKIIIWKEAYTPIFIAVLFTIARTWRQPQNPSTEKWVKKMYHIHRHTDTQTHRQTHTREYYSAIKKNDVIPSAATCMDL